MFWAEKTIPAGMSSWMKERSRSHISEADMTEYGKTPVSRGQEKKRKTKEMPSGSTIRRIVGKAYLMQEEPWVKDRKPRLVEDAHPHYHYVLGFGDKAVDVSAQYGVTIGFSDISDTASGFHLRYLYTGSDVKKPD